MSKESLRSLAPESFAQWLQAHGSANVFSVSGDAVANYKALYDECLEMGRQRDLLGEAIADAAKKAGIYNGQVSLGGPMLLMFADDLAESVLAARAGKTSDADVVDTKPPTLPPYVYGREVGSNEKVWTQNFIESYGLTMQMHGSAVATQEAKAQRLAEAIAKPAGYTIEGTVRFLRSDPSVQGCMCCPKGTGHVFSRGVDWDAWDTGAPTHFGNGVDVLVASKVCDVRENEGRRVRVTVEVLG